MTRTQRMNATDVAQRAGAARAYLQIAEESFLLALTSSGPSADAQASAANSVLAGIAASDAICGKTLGQRAAGQDHAVAPRMLADVVPDGSRIGRKLGRLLSDKTQAQYGNYCTTAKAESMLKLARDLIESMSSVHHIR